MQCKIANCKNNSTGYFATVPVCTLHRDKLAAETIDFYNYRILKRKLFESIRHLTPWKVTAVGDVHMAKVEKMKKDDPIAYIIRGERYIREK